MTTSRVRARFHALCRLVGFHDVGLRRGRAAEFPAPRDHAYCMTNGRKITVVYAPKLERASRARIDGVLMHEIGHAYHFEDGKIEHSERDADRIAEALFDVRIAYDDLDVQTTGAGKRPRPEYLDYAHGHRSPPRRRNGSREALVAHLCTRCGMTPEQADKLAPKKSIESPRRALSPEQLNRFKSEVRRSVRDPAIQTLLLLLPTTGMRIGEACALPLSTFEATRRGRLKAEVLGKGAKLRTVRMGGSGTALIREYMKRRPQSAHDRVFVGPQGGKITPAMVQAACRDVAERLGAPGLTPHVLRHTYATTRVLECRDLQDLRAQLGHGKLDGSRKTRRLPAVTMTYLDF